MQARAAAYRGLLRHRDVHGRAAPRAWPVCVRVALQELGRLDDAIQQKKVEVDSLSPWAFVAFFRYLALVQIDESWCKHLSRLDLLKEEIVLQSMSSDKGFLETYEESANEVFKTLLDDVRRNTVYSLFIYQGAK